MRRSFESEYRISSFNYMLLLFESVNRILTVVNARYEKMYYGEEEADSYDDEEENKSQNSKTETEKSE